VFTDPPVSGVGKCRAQPYHTIWKAPFYRAGRATVIGQTEGFVKVLCKGTRIEGCTIIGPRADDLVHECCAVMNSSSPTIKTIQKTIHIHPTLSEVMEALKKV
jgi:pyruvate/2-oxoglutarate dehydrogenase complex dihydrolipoamide dehydrogenase (E3) component